MDVYIRRPLSGRGGGDRKKKPPDWKNNRKHYKKEILGVKNDMSEAVPVLGSGDSANYKRGAKFSARPICYRL